MKDIYTSFLRRRMVGKGRPLLPEILGFQTEHVGAKPPIFNRNSLVQCLSRITSSRKEKINQHWWEVH